MGEIAQAEQPNFIEKIGDLNSKAKYFELRPDNMQRAYSEQIPIKKNERLVQVIKEEEEVKHNEQEIQN